MMKLSVVFNGKPHNDVLMFTVQGNLLLSIISLEFVITQHVITQHFLVLKKFASIFLSFDNF